jgi:hypothetical protein
MTLKRMRRIFFFAILLPLVAGESKIDVRTTQFHVIRIRTSALGVTVAQVAFGIHITNQGTGPIALGNSPFSIDMTQVRGANGGLLPPNVKDRFVSGDRHASPCSRLRPGESFDWDAAESWIVLMPREMAEAGDTPAVRLHIATYCTDGNDEHIGIGGWTEPVTLPITRNRKSFP